MVTTPVPVPVPTPAPTPVPTPPPGRSTSEFWLHLGAYVLSAATVILSFWNANPIVQAVLAVFGVLSAWLNARGYGAQRTELKIATANQASALRVTVPGLPTDAA